MKHVSLIVCFSLASIIGHAQDTLLLKKTMLEQGNAMGKYLVEKNYKSFVKHTHPKLLEMVGGEQAMIDAVREDNKQTEAKGYSMVKIHVDTPTTIIKEGNELQSTVQQKIEMKVPSGTLYVQGTLIAVSNNEGKHWYFIDTSNKDLLTMKGMFPNLSSNLVIPTAPKPVFNKDK